MRSPLLQALIDKRHFTLLTAANLDVFVAAQQDCVLFFTENPQHFPECNDVAVILPELLRYFDGRVTAAVVDASLERTLYPRYAFSKWPALVFLRRGDYVGVITGMQDWATFKQEFDRLLAAPVSTPPRLTIPLQVESAHCHDPH